jgi:hypothetical protein
MSYLNNVTTGTVWLLNDDNNQNHTYRFLYTTVVSSKTTNGMYMTSLNIVELFCHH